LAYFGLDAAIRGLIINGMRPDFVLIDDPETRESAASPHQIAVRSQSIDRDIAGLAGPTKRIARVMLCTIQNRYCLAYQYTDSKQKSSWSGKRFKMLETFPDNTAMWEEYIVRRQEAQRNGDKEGREATQYYLDNRKQMDAGANVSNPARLDATKMQDGWQIEVSALQHCYNIICDYGMESFLSECQNDPSEETGPETMGITAARVASRMSGLEQGEWHPHHNLVTVGIDLGKYLCHWVMIGWQDNCIGNVVDYGILEVNGVGTQTDSQASEIALFNSLVRWRSDMLEVGKPLDMVLIDSGDFTKTAYQFIREVGGAPFMVSKGISSSNFYVGKRSKDRIPGENWYASLQKQENIWLYLLDTDYWKQFVHERFMTPTFNEAKHYLPSRS
jgi:phage terminase large subunit GpA-like protein